MSLLVGRDEFLLQGNTDEGCHIIGPQFQEETLPVRINRMDGNMEFSGDLQIRSTHHDVMKDLSFAGSQRYGRLIRFHTCKSKRSFRRGVLPILVVEESCDRVMKGLDDQAPDPRLGLLNKSPYSGIQAIYSFCLSLILSYDE